MRNEVFWCRSVMLAIIAFQACSFIRLRSRAFIASYGEMSRRSGEAAKADNHSDISPFRINDLQRLSHKENENCVTPHNVARSLTGISTIAAAD